MASAARPPSVYAGKITDTAGKAIPAARVALWLSKPRALWPFGPEVLADANGRYEVKAAPPEGSQFDCRIFANATGYGSAQFRPISIERKQRTIIEMETIALKPANQSISGMVVYADGMLYVYEGPADDRTRDECLQMMAAGKLTKQEIQDRFGNAFIDGGGYNCRHSWVRVTEAVEVDPEGATDLINE